MSMFKTINVEALQPGMMVSKVLAQKGPIKIRKIGMIRSPEMIKGLTEMGVTKVEIDLEQSIGIELENTSNIEHDSNVDNQNEQLTKAVLTPTQQLMQNDRLVANADRDLSQQFHRSMFMPSPESMPSTWHLYGKNCSIMLLLVLGGACFGWNLAQLPTWMTLLSEHQTSSMPQVSLPAKTAARAQQTITDDEVNVGINAEQSDISTNIVNDTASTTMEITTAESSDGTSAQQAPLVLGYQPQRVDNVENQTASPNIDEIAQSEQFTTLPSSDASAISPELLAKFNAAIQELDTQPNNGVNDSSGTDTSGGYDDVPRVDQLSVALLTDMPAMSFSAHMYSSEPDNRWVRVNGLRLVEGDYIADDLQIINIEAQRVILSFRQEVFAMNALTDW